MPTTSRTFSWSPNEGLVDVGDDTALTVAYSADQSGSLEWTQTTGTASANGERARKSATTETWEGIFSSLPTGSTVTASRCMSFNEYYWAAAVPANARRLQIRLVDASGVLLLANDLFDDTHTIVETIDGSAVSRSGSYGSAITLGTTQAVLSASQPSNTPVRLEIQDKWTGGAGTPNADQELKNIVIEIDYTSGSVALPQMDFSLFPKPPLVRGS